ncbi:MAG: alpha-L-arabinofuranosidase [Armatimonadota bacterium]|nr:alpha-L-arabinofuranosidase [Armatimonadota bacterium]
MRWLWLIVAGTLLRTGVCDEFAHPAIYRDYPAGRWEDWSWASRNLSNTNPVYQGQYSIRVDLSPWSSLFFKNPSGFVVEGFSHLEFWVHGGSTGNPNFRIGAEVNGIDRPSVSVHTFVSNIPANQWTRVAVPLSALGVNPGDRLTGIHFREASGQSVPTFYLDEIRLLRANVSNRATVQVNFHATGRTITQPMRGINVATWDWYLTTPQRRALLRQLGFGLMRFPGGSTSNEYDWRNNRNRRDGTTYGTNTDGFLSVANDLGAEKLICVNYGSGTPQEAADWVQYANIQRNGSVRYWAIGNENYGSWEHDTHPHRHDAHTYAHFTRDAIQLMRAVDPTIKIGVVGVPNEHEFPQRFSVTNPRTGQSQNGWTAVLLHRLNSLGVVPDFFDIHIYPQQAGREDDAFLLDDPRTWDEIISRTRQILRDYLGQQAGNQVMIFVTENNSVAQNPGKQTTSMVNALYMADSWARAILAGADAYAWWDLHNSAETGNNNSPRLYGWRNWGDYGIVAAGYPSGVGDPLNTPYPTFFAAQLMLRFARPGDVLMRASSDNPMLSVYAVRTPNGKGRLLVINKMRSTPITAEIRLHGLRAGTQVYWRYYSAAQDAVRSKSLALRTLRAQGDRIRHTFPPMSVSVLEW